jgi:hypothetical protein
MAAPLTQEQITQKAAEVAQASQQKLVDLKAYVASPQAALDQQAYAAAASDSPLERGMVQAGSSVRQLGNLVIGNSQDALTEYLGLQSYNQANQGSLAAQRLSAAYEAATDSQGQKQSFGAALQGIGDTLSNIQQTVGEAVSPMDKLNALYENAAALGGGVVTQLPNSAVAMAGMGAGALAGTLMGGPVGTAAGMFAGATLGNMGVGQSEAIQNLMAKQGVDQNDTQAMEQFFQQNRGQLLQDNAIKSGVIGAVDTASLGMAGAFMNAPLKAATGRALSTAGVDIADTVAVQAAMKTPAIRQAILQDAEYLASKQGSNLIQSAGLIAGEMGSEGVGEYLGQWAATGDQNAKDAVLEGISSVGQSAGQHVIQKGLQGVKEGGLAVASAIGNMQNQQDTTQLIGQDSAVINPQSAAEQKTNEQAKDAEYEAAKNSGDISAFTNPTSALHNPVFGIQALFDHVKTVEHEYDQYSDKDSPEKQAELQTKKDAVLQTATNVVDQLSADFQQLTRIADPVALEAKLGRAEALTPDDPRYDAVQAVIPDLKLDIERAKQWASSDESKTQLASITAAKESSLIAAKEAQADLYTHIYPEQKQAEIVDGLVGPNTKTSAGIVLKLQMAGTLSPTQLKRALAAQEAAKQAGQTELPFTDEEESVLRILGKNNQNKSASDVRSDVYDEGGTHLSIPDYVREISSANPKRKAYLLDLMDQFRQGRDSKAKIINDYIGNKTPQELDAAYKANPVVFIRDAVDINKWVQVPANMPIHVDGVQYAQAARVPGAIAITGATTQKGKNAASLRDSINQEAQDVTTAYNYLAGLPMGASTPNTQTNTTSQPSQNTTQTQSTDISTGQQTNILDEVTTSTPNTSDRLTSIPTPITADAIINEEALKHLAGQEALLQGKEHNALKNDAGELVNTGAKTNLLAKNIKQDTSDDKPLTSIRNFISNLDNTKAAELANVPEIDEHQSAFLRAVKDKTIEFQKRLTDTIHKYVNAPPSAKVDKRNPILGLAYTDDQGNMQVEENVAAAFAVAGSTAIQGLAKTLTTKEHINTLIGRNSNAPVTDILFKLLPNGMMNENAMAAAIGKEITNMLGYKNVGKKADSEYLEKTRTAFGLHTIEKLIKDGIVQRVPISEYDLRTAADAEYGPMGKALTDAKHRKFYFLRLTPALKSNKTNVQNRRLGLSSRYSAVVEKELEQLSLSNRILNKIFAATSVTEGFHTEAPKERQSNFSKLPAIQRKTLNQQVKTEYVLNDSAFVVMAGMGMDTIADMAGIIELDDALGNPMYHADVIDSLQAKNDDIQLQINNLFDAVDELTETSEIGGDYSLVKFFLDRRVAVNQRNMVSGTINPQSHKFSRWLISHKSWNRSIDFTDIETVADFEHNVAEALGMNPDALQDALADPTSLISQAVSALTNVIDDSINESVHAEDQRIIKEIVREAKTGMHAFIGLTALADRESAKRKGTTSFKSSLVAEVDGKTNGVAIGILALGAERSMQALGQFIQKFGIYPKGLITFFDKWKKADPANLDVYQTGGSAALEVLSDIHQNGVLTATGKPLVTKKGARAAYKAMEYFLGKFTTEENTISGYMRELFKEPTLMPFFGSSLDNAAKQTSDAFLTSVKMKISESHKKGTLTKDAPKMIASLNAILSVNNFNRSPIVINPNIDPLLLMGYTFNGKELVQNNSIFNADLDSAIREGHELIFGRALKEGMSKTFSPFLERSKTLINVSQVLGDMADLLVKRELKKAEKEGVWTYITEGPQADGAIIPQKVFWSEEGFDLNDTASTIQAAEGIPVELVNHIKSTLFEKGLLPYAHTFMSKFGPTKNSADLSTGVAIFKAGKSPTDEKSKTIRTAGAIGKPLVDKLDNLRVGIVTRLIHPMDSAILNRAIQALQKKGIVILDIFDAAITRFDLIPEVAQELNKAFFEVNASYSPMSEMVDTLERMVLGLSNEEFTILEWEEFISKLRDPLSGEVVNITDLLTLLRGQARQADLTKLNTLLTSEYINQYSTEGGHYTITEKDRHYLKQQIKKTQAKYEVSLSPEITEAIKKLKVKQHPYFDQTTLVKTLEAHDVSVDSVMRGLKQLRTLTSFENTLIDQLTKALPKDVKFKYIDSLPKKDAQTAYQKELQQSFNRGVPIRADYFFENGEHTITVYGPNLTRQPLNASVLLHELVHAAVGVLIAKEKNGYSLETGNTQHRQATEQAITSLEKLMGGIKTNPDISEDLKVEFAIPLNDIQEFVSYGLTDKKFQTEVLHAQEIERGAIRNERTTLGRLINYFNQFIKSIAKILGFKTLEEAKGLGLFITDAMALITLAEQGQTHSFDNSDFNLQLHMTGTKASKFSTQETYDALSSQNTDTKFDTHLKNILGSIVNKLHGPFGLIHSEIKSSRLSADKVWKRNEKEKLTPLSNELRKAGLTLDGKQSFVMEQVYAAIAALNSNNELHTFQPYKDLRNLYDSVSKSITVDDLLGSAFGTTTKAEATKLHDVIFKVTSGVNNTSDYLARFAAIALTNPGLHNLLDQHIEKKTSTAKQSWAQKLQAIFENILEYIHSWTQVTPSTKDSKLSSQRLEALIIKLVDLEIDQKKVIQHQLDLDASPTKQSIESFLDKTAKSVINTGIKLASSDLIAESRFHTVKAISGLFKTVAGHKVDQLLRMTLELFHAADNGRLGLLAGLINSVKGQKEVFELLRVTRTHLDTQRKDMMSNIAKGTLNAFNKNGQNLSSTDKTALTAAVLKTNMHSLMETYSLAELEAFMSDGSKVEQVIQDEASKLMSAFPKHAPEFITNAHGLGYYAATGNSAVQFLKGNVYQIVNSFGEGNNRLTQKQLNIATEHVTKLTTMFALKYTPESDKQAVSKLMAIEAQRPMEEGNGIDFMLRLHRHLAEVELSSIYDNDPSKAAFGNIHEIYNPHVQLRAANIEDGQKLLDVGFEQLGEIKRDPHDPDQTTKHYYVLRHASRKTYSAGIVQFWSEGSTDDNITNGFMDLNNPDGILNAEIHSMINNQKNRNRTTRYSDDMAELLKDFTSKPEVNMMAPIYDSEGQVINWTYKMTENIKNSVLEKANNFDKVLGTLSGSLFSKQSTNELNVKALGALKLEYNASTAYNRSQFIEIGPKASNQEDRAIWARLPTKTQLAALEIFGDERIMVHKEAADIVFGYRKVSAADPFYRANAERDHLIAAGKPAGILDLKSINAIQKIGIAFVEETLMISARARGMTPEASTRYARRAATFVTRFESGWEEIVSDLKDKIVVVTGTVLVGNIFSNVSRLILEGIPLKNIVHYSMIAFKGASQYMRDKADLDAIRLKETLGTANKIDLRQIVLLEDSIKRNPATALIEEGMLPTIVEDLGADAEYAYKTMLGEYIDKASQKTPEPALKVIKTLMMTRESGAYKALAHITQLSDFVARYTMYQYQTTKVNPMSHKDAVVRANNAFVQYAVPMPRMMQYSDDIGLTLFTKYFLYIQRELFRLSKEQPGRMMTMVLLNKLIHLGPMITDSSLLHHLGNNPFRDGALGWDNAYAKILTMRLVD